MGSPGDDYYFGARINDNNDQYLDIVLEGRAEGWVAVGFTDTREMV